MSTDITTATQDSSLWTIIVPEGAHLDHGENEIRLVLKDGSVPAVFTKLNDALIVSSADWELKYRQPSPDEGPLFRGPVSTPFSSLRDTKIGSEAP